MLPSANLKHSDLTIDIKRPNNNTQASQQEVWVGCRPPFHVSGHAGINLGLKLLLCKMDTPLKNFKEQLQGGTNKPRGTLLSSRPRLSTTGARGSGSGTKLRLWHQVTVPSSPTPEPAAGHSQGFPPLRLSRFLSTNVNEVHCQPQSSPHAHSHQGFTGVPKACSGGWDVGVGKPQTPVTLLAPNTTEGTLCSLTVEEICRFQKE